MTYPDVVFWVTEIHVQHPIPLHPTCRQLLQQTEQFPVCLWFGVGLQWLVAYGQASADVEFVNMTARAPELWHCLHELPPCSHKMLCHDAAASIAVCTPRTDLKAFRLRARLDEQTVRWRDTHKLSPFRSSAVPASTARSSNRLCVGPMTTTDCTLPAD